jgi:exopolyphosphatase/pppGpp-phosphohydrolase
MTQAEPKLKLRDLRKIVKEELDQLNEQIDHAGIKDVVTGASKLLASVEAFKKSAPRSAINAVTPHINELERVLEDMVSSPGSYVVKPKPEPKKVSLKPVKG